MFSYKKSKAYSLLEFLIVLFVIALVVILSTNMLAKKQKKSFKRSSHGLYACTTFNGEEYHLFSSSRDIAIPSAKNQWVKGKCGQGFVMPDSGLMSVKLMGGGGAGGSAGIDWEDTITPQYFFESGSYSIPQAGYYDLIVAGSQGGSSSLSSWITKDTGLQCFAQNAKAGEPAFYQGTIYLSKNDLINIIYENAISVSLNLNCTNKITAPDAQPGYSGRDILITRNGSKMITVEGSKAGTYLCNSADVCSNHYQPIVGANGIATAYSYFNNVTKGFSNGSYEPGTVVIRWSDYNNTSKSFKVKKGCGGTSGEIRSALYPILKNTLPDITIGKGGTADSDPTATSFGSLKAEGGANNKICSNNNSNYNGMDGMTFNILKTITSAGGRGGISTPSDAVNGSAAAGFVSGGGGGAIYFSSSPQYNNSKTLEENKQPVLNGVRRWYQGNGGNGGSGLLILAW